MKHHHLVVAASAAWLIGAVACGARSELDLGPAPPAVQGGAGGVGGGEAGGGEGGAGGGPLPPECVVFGATATPAPLDMFIMMDQSGSMTQLTQGAGQKWWAVREALRVFFEDSESAGVGVAIAFFPIVDENVPTLCDDDVDCGAPQMCNPLMRCMPGSSNRVCDADEDCDGSDTCEAQGYCENAPNPSTALCFPTVSINCQPGQGPCLPYGTCDNRFTCDSKAYETPVVGVEPLPQVGAAVIDAIHAHAKVGGTPTLPALTGAVEAATKHLATTPGHKAVVVLATDGLPTVCDPALDAPNDTQAIANLAQVASEGAAQGVQTFVIGVFSPSEQNEVQGNLDSIAMAGGSGSAFVATTTSTVTQQFVEALRQVRLAGVCEFGFQVDDSGGPIDYRQLWVKLTDNNTSGETWISWVASADDCDPNFGGFYYDQPTDGPVPPSVLTLCPSSCSVLESAANKSIELFTGCDEPPAG